VYEPTLRFVCSIFLDYHNNKGLSIGKIKLVKGLDKPFLLCYSCVVLMENRGEQRWRDKMNVGAINCNGCGKELVADEIVFHIVNGYIDPENKGVNAESDFGTLCRQCGDITFSKLLSELAPTRGGE